MLRSKSIFATVLALSFLFSEAQGFFGADKHEVIGYATVSAEEAQHINADNKPHVWESDSLTQLGPGFYIVSEPGSRGWAGGIDSWYCAVKARRWKMRRIPKVYIPKSYEKEYWDRAVEEFLWGADEATIVEYIRSEVSIRKAEEALRFSWVKGMKWQFRMLIPKHVVENGDLDLWAQCFHSDEELLAFSEKTVEWKNWKIKGDPGPKGLSRAESLEAKEGLSQAGSSESLEDPDEAAFSPAESLADVPLVWTP